MRNSGVFTIESHTHDLHYKVTPGSNPDKKVSVFLAASETGYEIHAGRRWRDSIVNDLVTSRRILQDRLGVSSRFLAWPYGDSDNTVDQLAYGAGFERVCNLAHIPNGETLTDSTTTRLLPLNRYTITARTSLRTLREMLDGIKRADAL